MSPQTSRKKEKCGGVGHRECGRKDLSSMFLIIDNNLYIFSRAMSSKKEVFMATFSVINTDDSGLGSLRQAIEDANATGGLDTIE